MEEVEATLTPETFFATVRIREYIALHRVATALAIARHVGIDSASVQGELVLLAAAGLATETDRGWGLTEEGAASVRWAAPPPPDGRITLRWVGELSRACAAFYGTELYQVRHAQVGPAVITRSRLCFALYARGWSFERIDEHYALPVGWAHRGVERWKRLRDQMLPRTGVELRAWRKRLGLTQAQAAIKLGVSRRTVIRAERIGDLPVRGAIGQA